MQIDITLALKHLGLVAAEHDIKADEDYFRVEDKILRCRAGVVPIQAVQIDERKIFCAKLKDIEKHGLQTKKSS